MMISWLVCGVRTEYIIMYHFFLLHSKSVSSYATTRTPEMIQIKVYVALPSSPSSHLPHSHAGVCSPETRRAG